jgi:CheY-like chemotaxis protein
MRAETMNRPADSDARPSTSARPLVLVVDDQPENLRAIETALRRDDWELVLASSGREAQELLQRRPVAVALVDVQMPEMDGYETARRVRARWAENDAQRPRMIALTANAMPGDRDLCLSAGMDDYISKPMQIQVLQTTLERWGTESRQAS